MSVEPIAPSSPSQARIETSRIVSLRVGGMFCKHVFFDCILISLTLPQAMPVEG
jgi:hypothetical protein